MAAQGGLAGWVFGFSGFRVWLRAWNRQWFARLAVKAVAAHANRPSSAREKFAGWKIFCEKGGKRFWILNGKRASRSCVGFSASFIQHSTFKIARRAAEEEELSVVGDYCWVATRRPNNLLAGPWVMVTMTVTIPAAGADGVMVAVVPPLLVSPPDRQSTRSVDHW